MRALQVFDGEMTIPHPHDAAAPVDATAPHNGLFIGSPAVTRQNALINKTKSSTAAAAKHSMVTANNKVE
jgi:hypothetical protein